MSNRRLSLRGSLRSSIRSTFSYVYEQHLAALYDEHHPHQPHHHQPGGGGGGTRSESTRSRRLDPYQ
jgi:hypothetical protein